MSHEVLGDNFHFNLLKRSGMSDTLHLNTYKIERGIMRVTKILRCVITHRLRVIKIRK